MHALLLSAALAAAPADWTAGPIAGRSPPVARPASTPAHRPCGLVRHVLPAGKLPVLGSHHPCPAERDAARAPTDQPVLGR